MIIRFSAALAAALFLLCAATPAGAEKLSGHFSVWSDAPEVRGRLAVALVYSNEDGRLADGILHFMPLKDFLEYEYETPVVTVRGDPLYRVEYDSGFYDRFSAKVTFYEPSEKGFAPMRRDDGEPVTPEELKPGDYLMAIGISAEKGKEYYSGAAFLHIIVPGGERSVWPVQRDQPPTPTPTPTLTPTWPPTPEPTQTPTPTPVITPAPPETP